ncbi:restriction endonuclease [Methylomonas methanica]|jgi:restriction system protein|uniref:Restriction endonuclease n=1 Tax=Methylomonas methanica TaxID=421 RepID=A0A177LWM1_METMH|nr:restriction endonuclease [Methylomonas methanica]
MAIPDFQSIMRPLLEHLADGKAKSNRETLDVLSGQFHLTTDELAELLPSGQQSVFTNRIAWAKTHLKNAGLLESPIRGQYQITTRGLEAIKDNSRPINLKYLKQFEEYSYGRAGTPKNDEEQVKPSDALTPSEQIEIGYQRIREELEDELLAKIKEASPAFFERLVVELLVTMGYGGSRKDAGQTIGRSGDGGIDGVINEDRLGLDTIYIQAKRWEGVVGRPEIQKFAGALQGQRAKKGVFITTSGFSKEAIEYVSLIENRIALINGKKLTALMIDFGVGVSKIASYDIRRIDSDYFEE